MREEERHTSAMDGYIPWSHCTVIGYEDMMCGVGAPAGGIANGIARAEGPALERTSVIPMIGGY